MAAAKVSKFCPDCKQIKPVAAFAMNRHSHDGLHGYCRPCWAVRRRRPANRPRPVPPVPPFPGDLDRHAFGHWLSGLTDGEGCFLLKVHHYAEDHPLRPGQTCGISAQFDVQLRADDAPIIRLIHSFWACGTLIRTPGRGGRERPLVRLQIKTWCDLATVLVPHFETYPLRAKKARDFAIWRQAVLLGHRVSQRPRARRNDNPHSFSKWNDDDRATFVEMAARLVECRQYQEDEDHARTPFA